MNVFSFNSRYLSELTCLTNDTVIASLYLIADLILGISLALAAFKMWQKRLDGYLLFPHQVKLAAMLGALLSCSYFIDILVLYEGAYRLEVVFRGASAGVATILTFSFWTRRI